MGALALYYSGERGESKGGNFSYSKISSLVARKRIFLVVQSKCGKIITYCTEKIMLFNCLIREMSGEFNPVG